MMARDKAQVNSYVIPRPWASQVLQMLFTTSLKSRELLLSSAEHKIPQNCIMKGWHLCWKHSRISPTWSFHKDIFLREVYQSLCKGRQDQEEFSLLLSAQGRNFTLQKIKSKEQSVFIFLKLLRTKRTLKLGSVLSWNQTETLYHPHFWFHICPVLQEH